MSASRDGSGRSTGSAASARALLTRLWAGVRGVARWYSAINGGQDYQRYVAHLQRAHPGCPVPSERQYWRDRYAEAERNPTTRCC
ncbi:YbdD/YjiX family protein [Nocardia asteroides]